MIYPECILLCQKIDEDDEPPRQWGYDKGRKEVFGIIISQYDNECEQYENTCHHAISYFLQFMNISIATRISQRAASAQMPTDLKYGADAMAARIEKTATAI